MQNWQYLVLINLAPNLTTQIKLLHSFDAEGLVFKTAWGFPIFSIVRLQFFYQGLLIKILPIHIGSKVIAIGILGVFQLNFKPVH